MRTTTRKLLFLAVMIGLVSASSFGQITTPPVIDGDGSDAIWTGVTAMDLLRDNGTSGITDTDDFSGNIKFMWDADNVYVLLTVLDDTLITDLNNPWERDHYSVYFDFANLKTTNQVVDKDETKDSVQFMLEKIWSTDADIAFSNQGGSIDSSMVNGLAFVETIDSGTSYVVEMAVPLNVLGVDLQAEDVIGFGAKIGDNDGDGSLDGKYSLYQIMDEGWKNPSYLGTAKVEADGSFSKVKHTPVIDGKNDYEWYGATEYKLEVPNNDNLGVENAADFSGSIKTLWDDEYIYMLLSVKDDTLITDLNNPWERDHYSVYFDFANLKTLNYVKDMEEPMDSVQFMLEKIWSTEGDISFSNRVGNLDSSLVQNLHFVEMIDSGKGYTLEIGMPLNILGIEIEEGDNFGFDAKIGDNDGDGSLDGKYSWHQRLDEGWQNPSFLGNVELVSGDLVVDLGTTMKAKAQIEIDGEVDGDWSQAVPMKLERENEISGITDADDFSGVVKALWDEDNVYVLLEVKDDTLITDLNNPWERDHYSIYFDFGNHKSPAYLKDMEEPMDSVQFMLEKIWSTEGDISFSNRVENLDSSLVQGMDFVEVIDSGTGYLVEMSIPLDLIGVDLAADQVIGFDAKIGDNDGDGSLDGKYSWNQFADEGWQNPSFLGNVTLMANGTIEGTPEIEPESVTINVDVNGLITENLIDPATDMVDIAGSLNNWGDPVMNMADIDADGIYTITPDTMFLPGDVFEFKIRINGDWNGISEFPAGGPNRSYTVVEGDNIIDIVFNDGDLTEWLPDGVNVDRAALIHIYPNPASSTLNIKNVEEISTIELVNLLGQVTYRQLNSGNSSVIMSLDGQSSGIYMIRFTDSSNNICMKKLIIE